MAATTGLPEGETMSLVLANTIEKDNRIPPRDSPTRPTNRSTVLPWATPTPTTSTSTRP